MKRVFAALVIITLAGCISTPEKITGGGTDSAGKVTQTLPTPSATVATDLQDAAFNLDQAIVVGALPATDPAAKCLHGVLQAAGLEVPPGGAAAQSFVPKNGGMVSLGAIAYIQIRQAQAAGGIVVPQDCKTILGQFVLDGAGAFNKLLPGASLLPGLRLPTLR